MDEDQEKRGVISELKKDKKILILLIIILILGIYLRFSHYNEEGLWNDDMANVPAGLLWFYPHNYFPAVSSGNFPLGNLVIGAGCMVSGEDFSGVSKTIPMFYPGRELLIGEALTKGEWGCHLPMYIFGIAFLILISILSFMLLDRHSAIFVTAFFSFHPYLLMMSRWIRGDVVFWTILTAALIFLWKAYNAEKYTKKEIIFFTTSFAFLGLAHSAKETTPVFALFAVIIFLDKYSNETLFYLKKILKYLDLKIGERIRDKETNIKQFTKAIIYSAITYIFFLLLAFKLNPKNLYDTYKIYQQFNSEMSTIHFNIFGFANYFKGLLLRINAIDTIILAVAITIFIKSVIKKNKTKLDKFLVYYSTLGIVLSSMFAMMDLDRIAFPFLLLFMFYMGLSLTKITLSIEKIIKIKQSTVFFAFMIIYVAFSFSTALTASPYFASYNGLACYINKEQCDRLTASALEAQSPKTVAAYFDKKLGEEETFYGAGLVTHYYTKRSQHYTGWQFDTAFMKQTGREATTMDRIKYYHPNNETIRYFIESRYNENFFGRETNEFKNKHKPDDIIKIQNKEVFYIYDTQNLLEKP